VEGDGVMTAIQDPIAFELFKNALFSIADEMALTITRTTYSGVLKDNMDFMYCDPKGFYSYHVDEDVKKLKVSNHSTRLLETCIKMLKENHDPGLALRVLKRYTPENFETAAQWETWYDKNKSRLFFTETGGYKFLVNTLTS